MQDAAEKHGVALARDALLRSLFPPELVEHAASRVSAALTAKTRDGREDHAIQLRAADSVLDRVLPRETPGGSKGASSPVVVVIQSDVAELMRTAPKRIAQRPPRVDSSSA